MWLSLYRQYIATLIAIPAVVGGIVSLLIVAGVTGYNA